jgi:hypothetical protein
MVKNQAKIKYTEEFKQQVIEVYKTTESGPTSPVR